MGSLPMLLTCVVRCGLGIGCAVAKEFEYRNRISGSFSTARHLRKACSIGYPGYQFLYRASLLLLWRHCGVWSARPARLYKGSFYAGDLDVCDGLGQWQP